ncbi:uncharacterized protein LOC114364341, partial [Ostrinia furnacalis]|uniref:uncharacterized protein LOC114364341 n=1 Tax=Ostrinia furnacalis TaxID=93504 RepID=UPI00103C5A24
VLFVSILQIISTLVYMVYVGEFSNIIQFQSFRSFSFYCKYLELQEFLKNNRVSKNLVTVVNRYTLHLWQEARGVQVPHFLQAAPQGLKLRVMSAAYMHHLKESPRLSTVKKYGKHCVILVRGIRATGDKWQEARGVQVGCLHAPSEGENNRASKHLVPHFLQAAPQGLKLRVMSAAYMHHLKEHLVPHFLQAAPQGLKLRVMSAAYMHHLKENLVTVVNRYRYTLHFLQAAPQGLKLRVMSAAYMHHLKEHHISRASYLLLLTFSQSPRLSTVKKYGKHCVILVRGIRATGDKWQEARGVQVGCLHAPSEGENNRASKHLVPYLLQAAPQGLKLRVMSAAYMHHLKEVRIRATLLENNRASKHLVPHFLQAAPQGLKLRVMSAAYMHHLKEHLVPHFLQAAPQGLKLRVMSAAYMHHLKENPVFEECEPAFLRQLVGCLKLYTYNEGMYVVKESEITDSMYMIHTGRVMETSAASGDLKTVTDCFGLEQGLIYNYPFKYSYKTIIKSQVLTLSLNDWEYLLDHFPESKGFIYKYLKKDDDDSQRPGRTNLGSMRSSSLSGSYRTSYKGPLPPSAHRSSTRISRLSSQPPPPPSPPPSPSPLPSSPPTDYKFSPMAGPPSGPTTPLVKTDIPLAEMAPTATETNHDLSPMSSTSAAAGGLSPTVTTDPEISTSPQQAPDIAQSKTDMLSRTTTMTTLKIGLSDTSVSHSSLDEKPTGPQPASRPSSDVGTIRAQVSSLQVSPEKTSPDTKPVVTEPLIQTQVDLPGSLTEPIVAHPYSNISLKITELPPSTSKITTPPASTSKITTPPASTSKITTPPASTSKAGLRSTSSRGMLISEPIDDDADNELKPEEMQFIWPMDSRHSAAMIKFAPPKDLNESPERNDIDRTKSLRSVQSQQSSLIDSGIKRGPRDVDDALQDSMTLIDKVEKKAKKLFLRRKDSELDYVDSDESRDKDTLLLEEDEEATADLLAQIKKRSHSKDGSADPDMTEIVAVDEAQAVDVKSEVFELKPQTIRIQEPPGATDDTLAVVPYDSKAAASSSKHLELGEQETPSTVARKKSVHYKEESHVISDSDEHSPSEHSLDMDKPKDYKSKNKK